MSEPVIEFFGLRKYFKVRAGMLGFGRRYVHAVDDVDMVVNRGEIVGIAGESGSGKTTLARVILNLTRPTGSTVLVNGVDITNVRGKALKKLRSEVAVVFQDPAGNLNPRHTVGKSIMRPMIIHGVPRGEARKKALKALEMVKLDPMYMDTFPAQLSGGQQQRVAIARALVLNPKLMILDEPTSALDISVQAQVLNLLLDLQEQMGLTYLIITHDLNVLRYVCDRVFIMYLGKIVEYGATDEILTAPAHPYTKGLMAASPTLDPEQRGKHALSLTSDPGSLMNVTGGCRFAPRCSEAAEACRSRQPATRRIGETHFVACYSGGASIR